LNRTLCNLGDDPDGIAFEKLVRDLLKLRGDTSDPNPVTPPTGNDMSTDYLSQSDADSPNVKNPETVLYSGDRLSLNFQDIEVRAVLQVLGEFTGLNFVASDTVCGSITLRLKNVPWDQALDIVLNSKGLAMRQTGNVIMVAPVTEVAAQERLDLQSRAQIEELAPLCFEFIQIKYRKASDLAALIKSEGANLLSEHGSIIADQLTDTLLVRDTVSKLERIRGLVTRLDIPVRHG
jgi:type IV pilus assembly protein PilQ